MRSAIVVFPGSNREIDMRRALAGALERAGSKRRPTMVWHGDSELPDVDLIVLPGGFSYGDYLRAGSMAAHSPVMREVVKRAEAGTPILGVCNGFQVLCEAGLLPGALMRNADLKFACRIVRLRVERTDAAFACGYEVGEAIAVPVAHRDGNYFADPQTLDRLEQRGQVAFRYVGADGRPDDAANPNGSLRHIAGIYNKTRTVLGLMPHPENAVDPAHAGPIRGSLDGRGMFDGLVAALG